MSEPVRARYTYHPVTAVLGLLLALPIVADLREVSTSPNGHSLGRVVHGRGRKRALLAGMGLMEFLDQARTAAPQARIAVSGFSHAEERLGRLFHQGRSDGR